MDVCVCDGGGEVGEGVGVVVVEGVCETFDELWG